MKQFNIIIGTRPEAIKLAPVILEMRKRGVGCFVVLTGQHPDAARQALKMFGVSPDLCNAKRTRPHGPGSMLAWLVDWIWDMPLGGAYIVQGDTTTALAGALVGAYKQAPVIHVEAGLRTYEPSSPWPEEYHRQMIARLASVHLCPTEANRKNLLQEQVSGEVHTVGQTSLDAARIIGGPLPDSMELQGRKVLVTLHRHESRAGGIAQICEGIKRVKADYTVILHPNPQASGPVRAALKDVDGVEMIEAVPYPRMLELIKSTDILLTDSGGLVEEASYYRRPVLIAREHTERQEAVEAGGAMLVGVEADRVSWGIRGALEPQKHKAMSLAPCPFGDGHAARRIVDKLGGVEW